MDLTEIESYVDKLKELSNKTQNNNENEENNCDFFKKYCSFIEGFVTKLKADIEKNDQEKISKKRERERAMGVEKIQNCISMIFNKLNGYCQQNPTAQGKTKRKTEQRIKKLCNEIYDVGINTFNLELDCIPGEPPRLRSIKRRSWFSRSIDRISRSSSEYDMEEPEEERKLREEIEELERELEDKKQQLSEMREERRKREKEEREERKKEKGKKEGIKQMQEPEEEGRKYGEQVSLFNRIEDLVKDGECRQALEYLNNTSVLGTKILGSTKSKTPRMFIILPDPDKCPNGSRMNYWLNYKNWNKNVFNLHLLCECPGGIDENIENETHLLETTGYSIRDPYNLLSLFGPFLLYSVDSLMESCGDKYPREVVKALGKTKAADYFISLTHEIQRVIKEERLVHKNEKKNLEALEKYIEVSRGELETFLKGYDYSNMFGGLDRRLTKDKKIRWVCPKHEKKFK